MADVFRAARRPPRTITDLSPGLLVEVLRRLPYLYIVRSRGVSRTFRDVIDESWTLQLTIELGAAGYRRSNANSSDRVALETFRAFQRVYRNSRVQRGDRVELKEIVKSEWKVRMKGSYENTIWKQYGEYLVGDTLQGTAKLIDVLYLGSNLYGHVSRFYTLRLAKLWYVAAVEPNEDLLVMRDSREADALHFLSLRTGAVHPKRRDGGTLSVPGLAQILSVSGDWILLIADDVPVNLETSTCLMHWPVGTIAKAWGVPDDVTCEFNNGCLVGDHVFIPFWNVVDNVGLKASIGVWSIPQSPHGLVHHLSTFEVITFDNAAPWERYFNIAPAQTSPASINARRGFFPAQAVLSVWLSKAGLELFVQISTFLPEGDIYGPNERGRGPPVVRWEQWGQRAYIVSPLPTRPYYHAVSGLRVIYPEMIVDMNRFDRVENIYGYAPRPGPRGGRGRVDESYIADGLIGTPDQRMPALGVRPSYRVVPFRRNGKGKSLYFIEEDDGPKIVEVSWAFKSFAPSSMRFWTITEF